VLEVYILTSFQYSEIYITYNKLTKLFILLHLL